jgi:hypothetical protein
MKTITTVLLLVLVGAGCGQAASTAGTAASAAPDRPVSGPGDPDDRVMPRSTPSWVAPHPGGGPLRPVSPSGLRVGTRDGSPYAVVRWWSGIPPCSVLRSVSVDAAGATVRLRLVEGSDDPNAACAELAVLKATRVDLGVLAPGTYTVIAGGERRTLNV